MELLLQGFGTVLQPEVLVILIAGTLGGIVIGALPGLTATMGVALLTTLTFGMGPNVAMLVLVC
ncbi:MAG: tripartite tricarboxylate transporter permease, partial [Propionivibrio sp.]